MASPEAKHDSFKERFVCVPCIGLLLACCLIVACQSLRLTVPRWVTWSTCEYEVDLDEDSNSEHIALANRRLTVYAANGSTLFETPTAWHVCAAQVGDVNHDNLPELLMLVWRRGNYGTSRPFWETGFDLRMTEHLYVMGLCEGAVVPIWMGHDLGREVETFQFDASTGILSLNERNGTTTTWLWDNFGFVSADE